eukprot:scaffold166971_cov24-Prasinocladus_malaysianus.AAC.1
MEIDEAAGGGGCKGQDLTSCHTRTNTASRVIVVRVLRVRVRESCVLGLTVGPPFPQQLSSRQVSNLQLQ